MTTMDRIFQAVIALFGWFWLTVIEGLARPCTTGGGRASHH